MLWRLAYRIGFIELDEFGSYLDGRWRWPFCTKRTMDYAVRAAKMSARTEDRAKVRTELLEIKRLIREIREDTCVRTRDEGPADGSPTGGEMDEGGPLRDAQGSA